MKNGAMVREFETAFAEYVGAKYAIALNSGTSTLHTALVALGVKPGDRVAVPPLTMSATTIAVLHAGATPVFCDVDPRTWLLDAVEAASGDGIRAAIAVSLYGLNYPYDMHAPQGGSVLIDDAAQTLRKHDNRFAFTSYSFQASKILALGEGGMLVTDDEALATRAREFSSLGYRMRPDQPRIDPAVLKSPTFDRHHSLGWNYRMNDYTAVQGFDLLDDHGGDFLLHRRREAASYYARAIEGCDWLIPQHVPEGWTHDYWTFAVACDTPERALWLADEMEKRGAERPYPAWRLTYHEPAFRHLAPARIERTDDGGAYYGYPACPNAESLQPRLLQFQTNDLASAERNAGILRQCIRAAAITPS